MTMQAIPKLNLTDYSILSQIGTGTFATVYKARHNLTQQIVAIKVIDLSHYSVNPSDRHFLDNEVSIASRADFPLIAHTFQIIESEEYLVMVMEHVEGGTLLEYINANGQLQEVHARRLFAQLILTLQYLHEKLQVVHRDLKAENILLDRHGNIRLIDFGLSNHITSGRNEFTTVCGSPAYAAPELVIGQPYSYSVDLWSAGIILYAMVAGYLPFQSDNYVKMLHQIVETQPVIPLTISPPLADLISKMLKKSADERITIREIFAHPWLCEEPLIYDLQSLFIEVLDEDILSALQKMNISTRSIALTLQTHSHGGQPLISYKILKRSHITDQIERELMPEQSRTPLTKEDCIVKCSLPSLGLKKLAGSKAYSNVRSSPDAASRVLRKAPVAVPHFTPSSPLGDSPLTMPMRRKRTRALTQVGDIIVNPKLPRLSDPPPVRSKLY